MIKEQIENDFKLFLKRKASEDYLANSSVIDTGLSTTRLIKAEIVKVETAGKVKKTLDDNEVIALLRKLYQQRLDSAKIYRNNDRPELASKEEQEAKYIATYLPKLMDEQKTRVLLEGIIHSSDNPNIGYIMKQLKDRTDIDKKLVAKIAKELL